LGPHNGLNTYDHLAGFKLEQNGRYVEWICAAVRQAA
jgi:hypothetical protein